MSDAVTLRAMTDDELAAYRPWAIANLASQVAQSRGLPAEATRALAEGRVGAVLPDGRPIPGETFALTIVDHDGRVGSILAGLDRGLGPDRLYLYDIVVDEAARGRGRGRAAMAALERFAAEQGVREIALNVFGHNGVAQALYRSLGYAPQHLGLAKRLAE